MLTATVLLQVVLQETLRSEHRHLLLSGPSGQEVSNVNAATSTVATLLLLLLFMLYIPDYKRVRKTKQTECDHLLILF